MHRRIRLDASHMGIIPLTRNRARVCFGRPTDQSCRPAAWSRKQDKTGGQLRNRTGRAALDGPGGSTYFGVCV
jgi:hypothetical protein